MPKILISKAFSFFYIKVCFVIDKWHNISEVYMNTPITTERLIIRKYEEKDLNDLYEYLSDEEVVRFEPYTALSLEETKKES